MQAALVLREEAFQDVGRALQVALSLANLAALKQAQGNASAAEELLRRALAIREDALGPDHPLVSMLSACITCFS